MRDPQPGDVYEAWRWNRSELMALDPNFRPRNILIIGIGHAYLIDSLLDLPFVERIDVVDISREIVDAVRDNTRSETKRIFTDPRVRILIEDGRRFVQRAVASGNEYDLIQTKINEPWHAGSGNLFTVEFFKLQRQLLKDGGYLGTRPLLGHVSDGIDVFGSAVYPGLYHVFFRKGPPLHASQAVITPDIADAWVAELPGGRRSGSRADDLDVVFLDKQSEIPFVDANTDDRPTFEYYLLRQWTGRLRSPRVSLDRLDLQAYRKELPVVYSDGGRAPPNRAEDDERGGSLAGPWTP